MRKPLPLTIASVGIAVALAGCGSSSGGGSPSSPAVPSSPTSAAASTPAGGDNSTLEGQALKDAVTAAMQAATSFHLAGGATSDGKPVQFDIHFGPHKTAGKIVQAGEPLELINPGGPSVYFKAPDSLWQNNGGAAAIALFHNKWVKVPADDERFAGLTKSFDKDAFVSQMTADNGDAIDLHKVGSATVSGTDAIEYKSDSDHSVLYIAASGAPVILKIVNSSSDGGTLTFSDYGKQFPFAPPPANQTVDFAKLEKAGH